MKTERKIYELDGTEVDLKSFLAENDFDATEIAEIRDLAPGSSIRFGGGAAPIAELRCRVA